MDIHARSAGASAFSLHALTGAMAAGIGAGSEIFQFRWVSAILTARVTSVVLTGMRATTAFAAGAIDLSLTKSSAWTADGTGGTALTLTNNNRTRNSMTTSAAGARIATTAALGAGTKTLEGNPLGAVVTHSSGGFSAATPIIGSIYLPTLELFHADEENGQPPIVLSQNTGLSLVVTVPATGVWNLGLRMTWNESLAS